MPQIPEILGTVGAAILQCLVIMLMPFQEFFILKTFTAGLTGEWLPMVNFNMLDEVLLQWCGIFTMLALVQRFIDILFANFTMTFIISAGEVLITMVALFQSVDF